MANVDAPFGLRPIRYMSGAPYNGAANKYFAPSTYATALFIGDPVIRTSTANTAATRGYNPGTLPEINKASVNTGRITGVIVGFEPISGAESTVYGAASTARIVLVADDPRLVFECQDDGGGTLTAADVGLNASTIFTTAGSTVTGRSGVEIDGGTTTAPNTTQGLQLNLMRLSNKASVEVGDFAIWEVRINQHTEADNSTGI